VKFTTQTNENLKAAFAGESQANRLYLAFAKKAEKEGFTQIAKLFKAAAEAETVHALNHLQITGQVKSTLENLGTAVTRETYEFKKMYPEFIAEAKKEGNKQAAWSLTMQTKLSKFTQAYTKKHSMPLKTRRNPQKRTITCAPSAETHLKAQRLTGAQSALRLKINS